MIKIRTSITITPGGCFHTWQVQRNSKACKRTHAWNSGTCIVTSYHEMIINMDRITIIDKRGYSWTWQDTWYQTCSIIICFSIICNKIIILYNTSIITINMIVIIFIIIIMITSNEIDDIIIMIIVTIIITVSIKLINISWDIIIIYMGTILNGLLYVILVVSYITSSLFLLWVLLLTWI